MSLRRQLYDNYISEIYEDHSCEFCSHDTEYEHEMVDNHALDIVKCTYEECDCFVCVTCVKKLEDCTCLEELND